MAEWEKKVKHDLRNSGFHFKRYGKGSHEIWTDGLHTVVVPHTVDRDLANAILKEAEINKKY